MKYSKLNLGQIEAVMNAVGGEEGVKRLLSGELVVRPLEFLKKLHGITVGGFPKGFYAADQIVSGAYPFNRLSDEFKRLFLGKVEHDVRVGSVSVYEIQCHGTYDFQIRAELGERVGINLAHLFQLLVNDTLVGINSESGNGGFAHVRGVDNNLYTVQMDRVQLDEEGTQGWELEVLEPHSADKLGKGCWVLSS